jgi:hypothetical protein
MEGAKWSALETHRGLRAGHVRKGLPRNLGDLLVLSEKQPRRSSGDPDQAVAQLPRGDAMERIKPQPEKRDVKGNRDQRDGEKSERLHGTEEAGEPRPVGLGGGTGKPKGGVGSQNRRRER